MAINKKIKEFSEKVWAINSLVSKDDFVKAFETLLKVVVKVEENQVKRINDKLGGAQEAIEKMSVEQKASFLSKMEEISDMVRDHKEKMERMKKGHAEEMASFEERMGKKMFDMEANIPLMSQIMEECMKLMPKPLEPDTADDIRNKLEVLPDGEKLKIEAIEDLRKELEELRKMRVRGMLSGGGTSAIGVAAAIGNSIKKETPSGAINGSNTTYTVSKPINAVFSFAINGMVIHDSEYTIAGRTISMITAISSDFSGTTFRITYV